MNRVPTIDEAAVLAQFAHHENVEELVFNPTAMLAEIQAYRAIRAVADEASLDCQIDWTWAMSEIDTGQRFAGLLEDLGPVPDWAEEDIAEHLVEAARQNAKRDLGELSAPEYAQLLAFMRAPDAGLAASHRMLRHVPNAAERMTVIETARKQAFARSVCSERREPLVLRSVFEARTESGQADVFELWTWVATSANNIDIQAPDVYVLCASLVRRAADEQDELVGTLHGPCVCTLPADDGPGHEELFEVMDAHSQQLNDVWKTIQTDFLPKNGFTDLEELTGGLAGVAICCPWVDVRPEYRGRGATALLLYGVVEACRCASMTLVVPPATATGKARTPAVVDPQDDSCINRTAQMLENNPTWIFAVEVEGTPPESAMRDIMARATLEKVPAPKVVDSATERRRLALRKHFEAMSRPDDDLYVHTYNPWDFPCT